MYLKEFIVSENLRKKYILDASVAIKWYFTKNESELDIANYLYERVSKNEIILVSPDLILYEVSNFFTSKLEIPLEKINDIISEINDIIFIINIDSMIALKSLEISRKINKSFYDSMYVALSELLDCPLITADFKLKQDAKMSGYNVLLLSELKSIF
jgi:predicted nucleic acid-binding protein